MIICRQHQHEHHGNGIEGLAVRTIAGKHVEWSNHLDLQHESHKRLTVRSWWWLQCAGLLFLKGLQQQCAILVVSIHGDVLLSQKMQLPKMVGHTVLSVLEW